VRLARLLLSALKLQSPAAEGANVPLDLGMSQGELALLIGASRPKVNIALTMLRGHGRDHPLRRPSSPATPRSCRASPTME
jgi:hypothetical protein